MKCIVHRSAVLHFPDGRRVELAPGVQDVEDDVTEHWAFSAYAEPIEKEAGNAKKQPSANK